MTQDKESLESRFVKIYQNHTWGGESLSGPGSDLDRVKPYIRMLRRVLGDKNLQIESIVDIGCGDWAFSRTIDWGARHYTGIDVVPSVIRRLQETYGSKDLTFIQMNVLETPPPEADLLLIKDVLQHLSNDSVSSFLAQTLPRYRYALITNDYRRYVFSVAGKVLPKFVRTPQRNSDTNDGGSRPLDLRSPPFSLKADQALRYSHWWYERKTFCYYIKETLFWRR